MAQTRLLTVPGYTGSGPQHWQSLWEAADSTIRRIEQQDWDYPEADAWSAAIDTVVRQADRPAILVAHSCGSIAVAHWAARFTTPIAGAFLVAPPDSDRWDLDDRVRAFALPILKRLPFPTVVVASENDPSCEFDRAAWLAGRWGAELLSAGNAGHVNTASGHGPWPQGRRLLDDFCARVERNKT